MSNLPMKEDLPDGGVRDWTRSGEGVAGREQIALAIDGLAWLEDPAGLSAIYATALEIVVAEFGLPNVRAVAVSVALSPLGLLAVESDYANGRVRHYFADGGDKITPLCADFWAREGGGSEEVPFVGLLMFADEPREGGAR